MTYRDESEALHARVESLEGELAVAKETIARLQGEVSPPIAPPNEKASWSLGAPARLTLEKVLPFATDEDAYGPIAELLRARLSRAGQVSQVARTLSYRHASLDVSIEPTADGRTRLRLDAHHAHLGMLTVVAAFSAMMFSLAPIGATLGPASLLVSLPLIGLVTFFVARALMARSIQRQRAQLIGVVESIAAVAAQHAAPAIRVAVPSPVTAQEDEQVATEAEETSRPRVS